jgi:protein-tyrosine phosphatase
MENALNKMNNIYVSNLPSFYTDLKPIYIFDWLLLGNLNDAINFTGDAIVSVFDEHELYKDHFSKKLWIYIDIVDNINQPILKYFNTTFECLDLLEKSNKTCIIHCHAGINRSATFAIAYYMYKKKTNLFKTYDKLSFLRPGVISNIGFRRQLILWAFDNNLI